MSDGGGGSKPIIRIPIDSSEFDAFTAKFDAYRKDVDALPEAWKAQEEGVVTLKTSFDQAAVAFAKIQKIGGNSHLTGQSSFVGKFEKSSATAQKSWALMTKDIEKSSKGLSGFSRLVIGLSSRGLGIAGVGVGVGFSLGAAVPAAASDLARQNRENRSLGLKPGEAQAFDADYQQFGLGTDDLHRVADARSDVSQWKPFLAAGLSQDQITKEDLVSLTTDFAKAASAKYADWQKQGLPAATLAKSYGFDSILSTDQLRTAGSYGDADWTTQRTQYQSDVPRLAVEQNALDTATKALSEFSKATDEVKNSLEGALMPLAPMFENLAVGLADSITAFSRSGELKDDVDSIATAFEGVAKAGDWVADKLNTLFGGAPKAPDGQADGITWGKGGVVAGVVQSYHDIRDYFEGKAPRSDINAPGTGNAPGGHWAWPWSSAPPSQQQQESQFKTDPNKTLNMKALEDVFNMPKGLLSGVEKIESTGGDPHQMIGKDGKYLGAYQFDQATAKQYRVNVYDEYSSEQGAAKLLHDRYVKYGSWDRAVASYDGDTHLDADIARFGDRWIDHAPKETQDYIASLKKQGVDLAGDQEAVKAQAASARSIDALADQMSRNTSQAPIVFKMPAPQNALPQPANVRIFNQTGSSSVVSVGGLGQ